MTRFSPQFLNKTGATPGGACLNKHRGVDLIAASELLGNCVENQAVCCALAESIGHSVKKRSRAPGANPEKASRTGKRWNALGDGQTRAERDSGYGKYVMLPRARARESHPRKRAEALAEPDCTTSVTVIENGTQFSARVGRRGPLASGSQSQKTTARHACICWTSNRRHHPPRHHRHQLLRRASCRQDKRGPVDAP